MDIWEDEWMSLMQGDEEDPDRYVKDIALNKVANEIIRKLKARGFRIQRYDAVTSSSIYLKMDYGVCNSIRISDHKGKKHLQYRYNVIKGHKGPSQHKSPQGWPRYYYGLNDIDKLIKDILKARDLKISNYGVAGYLEFMNKNQRLGADKSGFWQHCVEV